MTSQTPITLRATIYGTEDGAHIIGDIVESFTAWELSRYLDERYTFNDTSIKNLKIEAFEGQIDQDDCIFYPVEVDYDDAGHACWLIFPRI